MAGDAAFESLETYTWRIGQVYPNPNHIIDAPKPWQACFFYVGIIPMKTVNQVYYSAPNYVGAGATLLYPVSSFLQNNYGDTTGQAPTSGIYTGIPSGCSGNGVSGGNPY